MLIGEKDGLQTQILALLSKKQGVSASEVQRYAAKRYRFCSIQAVYKELRALQAQGIVVKVRGEYSFSLSWILNSLDRITAPYSNYVQSSTLRTLLSGEKKRSWYFSDLRRLDDLWIQIALGLLQEQDTTKAFSWVPYPWFELIHHEQDQQFQNALKINGCHLYHILAGDSELSRYYADQWDLDVYTISFAEGPYEDRRDLYLFVCGEYIFSFSIDLKTCKGIEEIFHKAESPADLSTAQVVSFFNQQGRMKATLEHNPRKSLSILRQFKSFFGVK